MSDAPEPNDAAAHADGAPPALPIPPAGHGTPAADPAPPAGHETPAAHPAPPAAAGASSSLLAAGGVDSVISVVAFMVANKLGGLGWAIAASTAWSLKAAITRKRKGQAIGKLLPITAGYLLLRGGLGIVTDSKALYFGMGIATQAAIGLGLVVSVLVGRAFIAEIAPKVLPFPRHVVNHRLFQSTMAHLTLVAGAYEMGKSGWDVWLYHNSSTNGFVLLRFLAGWLTGFVAISGSMIYADRRLRRIDGFDGLLPMFETMAPGKAAAS
jgi:hypothetical protein